MFHQLSLASSRGDTQEEFVFEIDYTFDNSRLLASASDNCIHVVDLNNFQLIGRNNCHTDKINALEASRCNSNIFYTGSDDLNFKIWDLRTQPQPIFTKKLSDEVLALTVGMEDTIMAIGCGNSIIFYDIRMTSSGKDVKLGEYSDIHTDIITNIKFQSKDSAIVAAASEDGLISVFDITVAAGDEAIQSILNNECAVRNFGFFGPSRQGIYSLSTTETASFWHYPSAQRVGHFADLRDTIHIDYLVNCVYDEGNDSLTLLAGDYEGNFGVFQVEPTRVLPVCALQGGHTAMVRCAQVMPSTCQAQPNSRVLCTGGEDSKLCMWTQQDSSSSLSSSSSASSSACAAADSSLSSSTSHDSSSLEASKQSHHHKSSNNNNSKSGHLRFKPY